MDLGECTKIHDLALRADYEIASKERDLFFELDVSDSLLLPGSTVSGELKWKCLQSGFLFFILKAVDHLESFIAECDRRTELAKKRLAETQEEISAEVAAKVRDQAFFLSFCNISLHIRINHICDTVSWDQAFILVPLVYEGTKYQKFLYLISGREGPWAERRNRKATGQGWTARSRRQCWWGPKGLAGGGEGAHKEEGRGGERSIFYRLHILNEWR